MSDTLTRGGLRVSVLETPDLGDRTHVVDDGEVALVVDPQRDLDRVHAVLSDLGLRLGAVAETHLHNDYVTGGLELSRTAGVPYLVPAGAEVAYERDGVDDGDERSVGRMTVRALATPGHTPHHLAYAVAEGDAEPAVVLTGGSLLFGAVGRTDLVDDALTEELTREQHRSVRRLVGALPDETAVLPTHGFGSFCSATPTSGTASTVGEQRDANPAMTSDEDAFVEELLAGLGAYPAFYAHVGPRNAEGPAPVDLSPPAPADAAEVRRRIEAGEWVVDLRSRSAFARGHAPGSLSFDASGNVATYLGWTIPWGTPVTLLGDTAEQVADVQRSLVRIGIDRPAAAATGDPESWSDRPLASYRRVTFEELAAERARDEVLVLDVRRDEEWTASHVEDAVHVPLHELADRVDEVPADREVWVHCGSGFRAAVAASLLERAGRRPVHVDAAFADAEGAGVPLVGG